MFFGLGFWEITILIIVLVAIFGIGPVKAMASKAFAAKQQLDEAKDSLRDPLGLKNFAAGEKEKK